MSTVFFDKADGSVELGGSPYASDTDHLADELALADLRLARARLRLAGEPATDIDARIATTQAWIGERVAATSYELPLAAVARRLSLLAWELDVLVLLAAIELDSRRLVQFAVNDVPPPALTPTIVREALGSVGASVTWQADLFATGSVIARGILTRGDDPVPQLPQAAAPLRLARNVFGALIGAVYDDPLLDGILRRPRASGRARPSAESIQLSRALVTEGIALWVNGGADAIVLVEAIAQTVGRELRVIDVRSLARESPWGRTRLARALHLDQQLRDWLGVIDAGDGPAEWFAELGVLAESIGSSLIVVSEGDIVGLGAVTGGALRHTLGRPDAGERDRIWTRALAHTSSKLVPAEIHELADAFPMAAREIDELVSRAELARESGTAPTLETYRNLCVARQSSRLGRLADFVPPSFRWDDLVLPAEEVERLREIIDRQRHRHTVFTTWNMAAKVPYGSGTAALFSGPPGTGKTMAASVVAGVLERELYRVDLSRIVDKYIGETEKNLGRIFDAAADADAVLLFDEADSLFGKRSSVQSSNDRYANLETNYLLQRIEQHPGISILTTNHAQNIDEAFSRRIPFRVEFPFPDPVARAEIWRRCFTANVPRDNLDFRAIGNAYELAGGHIKSAVLRAVFMAAATNTVVSSQHIARAAARELESMGKLT